MDEHTNPLEAVDLDRLKELLVVCNDGRVREVTLQPGGGLTVKFHAPEPEAPQVQMPLRPSVDSPPDTQPSGYAKLLGKLPDWPKAGG